jgi:hypothetical protein
MVTGSATSLALGVRTARATNYTNSVTGSNDITAHPPVVGFSADGILIYGRYLSTSAPGFQSPKLDACGGHSHTSTSDYDAYGNPLFGYAGYHYHTQVFDGVTSSTSNQATPNEAYTVSTVGPFKCWKANIAASSGSGALLAATASSSYKTACQMNYRCCGMTDYYLLNGVTLSGANNVASTTKCVVPSAPTNGAYTQCTVGGVMYSGNQCVVMCNTGTTASAISTAWIKGVVSAITCTATYGSEAVYKVDITAPASATTSLARRRLLEVPAADGAEMDLLVKVL